MNKTLRSLVVAAAVTSALSLIPLASASASELTSAPATFSSANWAGYVATTSYPQPDQFGAVQATFTVPAVSCKDSTMSGTLPDKAGWYSAAGFWVGLGGVKSAKLEQDGVIVICANKTSSPAYSAFYEMVPLQPSGKLVGLYTKAGRHVVIHAGDVINAITWDYSTQSESTSHPYAPGHAYRFQITDRTQHATSRIPIRFMTGNDQTVEVISEALNGGPWDSAHTGLAHFSPVKYTSVLVSFNGGGYAYGINTAAGSASATKWTLTHGKRVLISTSGIANSSDPTASDSFSNTWHK
jgi:hypothetical protein